MAQYIDSDRMAVLATEPEISEELIEMFYLLADRFFANRDMPRREITMLMDLDDARQEAAMACINALPNYRGGSAYSYFSYVVNGTLHDLIDYHSSKSRCPLPGVKVLSRDWSYRSDLDFDAKERAKAEFLDTDHCMRLRALYYQSEMEGGGDPDDD